MARAMVRPVSGDSGGGLRMIRSPRSITGLSTFGCRQTSITGMNRNSHQYVRASPPAMNGTPMTVASSPEVSPIIMESIATVAERCRGTL